MRLRDGGPSPGSSEPSCPVVAAYAKTSRRVELTGLDFVAPAGPYGVEHPEQCGDERPTSAVRPVEPA